MKKLLLVILILLLCFVGYVYFIIPNKLSAKESVIVTANIKGLHRILSKDRAWLKWWPGESVSDPADKVQVWEHKGLNYSIKSKLVSSFLINVSANKLNIETSIDLIPLNLDSTELTWKAEIKTSGNPISRIQQYSAFKKFRKHVKKLLGEMKYHYSQVANIYEIEIYTATVKDSILVSTFAASKGYPSTAFIYGLIDELKKYTKAQSAIETGDPMLNVITQDSIEYMVRVAIPVNKKLPSSGNISYKWMLGGGNILIAQVTGGVASANEAIKKVENYISDFEMTAPAIPFESLSTNRMNEPDTNKWLTTIYYPVMWLKSNR